MTLAREDARAVWIWPWLESLWQDAAYGFRTMRREPAFTATALLALGSAIGVNTSLFTIFNAFALRPWACAIRPRGHAPSFRAGRRSGISASPSTATSRSIPALFPGLVAMRNGEQVRLDDRPLQLTYVSGNYFRVLGVELERGRGFLAEEDLTGDPQAVAVISHDAWQNRFGGDPQIVGRTIRLDDVPFTVVGVTPADFTGTSPLRNDLWMPLPARRLLRPNDPGVKAWLTSPRICCTPVAGRLAPGVTAPAPQAELSVLVDQFRTDNQHRSRRPANRCRRHLLDGQPSQETSSRPHDLAVRRGYPGAAVGVRQHRQSVAGPRRRPPPRDCGPSFARRQPSPPRAPTAGRKPAAG